MNVSAGLMPDTVSKTEANMNSLFISFLHGLTLSIRTKFKRSFIVEQEKSEIFFFCDKKKILLFSTNRYPGNRYPRMHFSKISEALSVKET